MALELEERRLEEMRGDAVCPRVSTPNYQQSKAALTSLLKQLPGLIHYHKKKSTAKFLMQISFPISHSYLQNAISER